MGDICACVVEEEWERIQCGVQDVNSGVIRDVRVEDMCVEHVSASVVQRLLMESSERWMRGKFEWVIPL